MKDRKKIANYARESVNKALNAKYLTLDEKKNFNPKKEMNREELKNLNNRVIVHRDLGPVVEMIPHDLDTRVLPLDEEQEEDEILIGIVERLGEKASWKNSNIQVVEV